MLLRVTNACTITFTNNLQPIRFLYATKGPGVRGGSSTEAEVTAGARLFAFGSHARVPTYHEQCGTQGSLREFNCVPLSYLGSFTVSQK